MIYFSMIFKSGSKQIVIVELFRIISSHKKNTLLRVSFEQAIICTDMHFIDVQTFSNSRCFDTVQIIF
jgi:hypothetical protein